MPLCPTDKQGRALVARRNLGQLLEAHPCLQQPQYHNQSLGLRITLPSTEQSQAKSERLESQVRFLDSLPAFAPSEPPSPAPSFPPPLSPYLEVK